MRILGYTQTKGFVPIEIFPIIILNRKVFRFLMASSLKMAFKCEAGDALHMNLIQEK